MLENWEFLWRFGLASLLCPVVPVGRVIRIQRAEGRLLLLGRLTGIIKVW